MRLLAKTNIKMSSVVWITKLLGAGKSTLAYHIAEKTVVTLDGDELCESFEVVKPNKKTVDVFSVLMKPDSRVHVSKDLLLFLKTQSIRVRPRLFA